MPNGSYKIPIRNAAGRITGYQDVEYSRVAKTPDRAPWSRSRDKERRKARRKWERTKADPERHSQYSDKRRDKGRDRVREAYRSKVREQGREVREHRKLTNDEKVQKLFPVLCGQSDRGTGKLYLKALKQDPCAYCGERLVRTHKNDRDAMEFDHIEPVKYDKPGNKRRVAAPATYEWPNLTTACYRCNYDKGRASLLEYLAWPKGWLR